MQAVHEMFPPSMPQEFVWPDQIRGRSQFVEKEFEAYNRDVLIPYAQLPYYSFRNRVEFVYKPRIPHHEKTDDVLEVR